MLVCDASFSYHFLEQSDLTIEDVHASFGELFEVKERSEMVITNNETGTYNIRILLKLHHQLQPRL